MIDREERLEPAYKIMKRVLRRGDAGDLGRLLKRSADLITAWCRRPPEDDGDRLATGKFGPLDRLRTLIVMVGEDDGSFRRAYPIGHYIAKLLGGIFVPLPHHSGEPNDEILQHLSAVLKETSEAIEETRVAWFVETPGTITNEQGSRCLKEISEAQGALELQRRWVVAQRNKNRQV